MLLRVMLMLSATVLVYRSLMWSLDTPLLRGAWRRRKLSYGTKMGLVAVLAFTIRFMRMYGDGLMQPATLISGLFFLIAGTAVVLFCEFIAQDVREVFWLVAKRLCSALPEPENDAAEEEPEVICGVLDRSCRVERNCSATPQPCGARGLTNPWRPAELPRKRQHR
jgi:hypothetical protein